MPPGGLILIAYPGCPGDAKFAHAEAALAFLRTMAGQLSMTDFVAIVSATSGPTYAALARTFIGICLGQPS